jgi:hypothetical protein
MRASLPVCIALLLASCAPVPPAPAAVPDPFAAVEGSWTGVLEYADYGSGRRVQLPTHMVAAREGDGRTLVLRYVYREPSGDTVTSQSVHRMESGRYLMGSDTFAVTALEGFIPGGGGGRMVVEGTVEENDQPQPARHTLTLAGDSLRMLTETRSPPQFRNEYRMVRAPAAP